MNVENWKQILSKAGCGLKEATAWAPHFVKYLNGSRINNPKRVAAFVANLVIESNHLRTVRENLNYSAQGLANTWPKRFSASGLPKGKPNALALSIARKPKDIANHTYANRMGNGGPETGDGWKHAGKGPIQITGKDNYQQFFKAHGLPADTDTEKLTDPDLGVASAVWYWNTVKANDYVDRNDFDGVCDIINIGRKTRAKGDAHGYNARYSVYSRLLTWLTTYTKLIDSDQRQAVLSIREMENVTPPEITYLEEDPLGEIAVESVQDYEQL